MKADRENFINSIQKLDADGLKSLCLSLYDRIGAIEAADAENKRIYTQVHIQYAELKEKYDNEAVFKALYLRLTELYDKWAGRPVTNWAMVRNQLSTDDKIKERMMKYEV